MSTRWYPIYQKGNPQLRVYLPNFFMKLVQPDHKQPPNIVKFIVSNEMTNHDIRNYLKKIYNVSIADVRSSIVTGEFRQITTKRYIVKDDDYKVAYVTLPHGEVFEFPNLFPEQIKEKQNKEEEDTRKATQDSYKKFLEKNKNRPGLPEIPVPCPITSPQHTVTTTGGLTPPASSPKAPNGHCEWKGEGVNKPWCESDAPAPPPRSEFEPPRACPDTAPTADRPWCQRGPLVNRISPPLSAPAVLRVRPEDCPAEYFAQQEQRTNSYCQQNQSTNRQQFAPKGCNVDYQTTNQPNCCSKQNKITQRSRTGADSCLEELVASNNRLTPRMGPEGCFEEPLPEARLCEQGGGPEIPSARVGAPPQQDTSRYNQPDHYLKQLCDKYPKPTAVVTATPRDELMRRVYADRYRTTYQADFCKNGDDSARLLASCDDHDPNQRFKGQPSLLPEGAVSGCRCGCGCVVPGTARQLAAQPGGDSLNSSTQPPLCRPAPVSHNVHFSCCYTNRQKQALAGKALSGESVGPPEKLPPWISEYSDSIGRTGQVIIDQKLLHPKKKQKKF